MDGYRRAAKGSAADGAHASGANPIKALLACVLAAALVCTVPGMAFAEEGAQGDKGAGAAAAAGSLEGVSGIADGLESAAIDEAVPVAAQDDEYIAQEGSFAANMFLDTPQNAWFVKDGSLDYAIDNQLMNGFTDGEDAGNFLPYGNASRGQVVTVLWRMAGKPSAGGTKNFSDLDSGSYYAKAVKWAASKGIVNGYTGTSRFGGDDPVTREQLAKMLAEFANKISGTPIDSDCKAMDKINGAKSVSKWARGYMGWAVDNDLIGGVEKKGKYYLQPQDNAWRSAVAKMIKVLRRDVLALPYSSTTQSQREQIVLQAVQKVLADNRSTGTVSIAPASPGRARSFQLRHVWNYSANVIQIAVENNQEDRDTYNHNCSVVDDDTAAMYEVSSELGVNLPAWGVMVSSDYVTLYESFNGHQRYRRF